MRVLLTPLSWLYQMAVWVRNAAFDAGVFRTASVPVPVISVGNISAGGTGKTPVVEEIARMLTAKGKRVAVLSRGYGRATTGFRWVSGPNGGTSDPRVGGDEPVQIARNVPGALVAVDESRLHGAETIIREASPDVILLDDGFQHRWLRRDLDIVVVRRAELETEDALLPAGRRREPMENVARAGAMIVTDVGSDEDMRRTQAAAAGRFKGPVMLAGLEATGCVGLTEGVFGVDWLRGRPVVACSGIGDPSRFERTLVQLGCTVRSHVRFRDHHQYTPADVDRVMAESERVSVRTIITTQKDAVRLSGLKGSDLSSFVALQVRVRWRTDAASVEQMVGRVFQA